MLRLIAGLLATGLLLGAPGPLGPLVGQGSRVAGVTLVWLFLGGMPGGRPVPVGVLLACALPCTLAALRLEPASGAGWPHLILGWALILLLADGAYRVGSMEGGCGSRRSFEIAWWGCLVLPQVLLGVVTWGGLQQPPVWLQGIVDLGPFNSFFMGEMPQQLSHAPVLTLVPWLLAVFSRESSQ